jgi:UDP-N-acetylmuramoyl-tripeptide--D-alanyl-D-alanine ligase
MGISGFDEMRTLSRIVRPDVGVFTVIGHAHLEFLHDLDGVLAAKTEMLENMAPDAWIVVNGDDALLRDFPCSQRKLSVGLGEGNMLHALDVRQDAQGTRCTITGMGRNIEAEIPAFGRHMVYAALDGAAVGILQGMSDDQIAAGIRAFKLVGRRAAVCDTGSVTLVDDSYNANPDSVKCGVDSLLTLPGRHVCILGDMRELGEDSPAMHFDVGRYAAEKGADAVLTSGEYGEDLAAGAGEKGRCFESTEALIEALPSLLRRGDAILVKASRGSRFERVSEAIKELRL